MRRACNGQAPALARSVQFADYTLWQHEALAGRTMRRARLRRQLAFLTDALKTFPTRSSCRAAGRAGGGEPSRR